MTLIGITKVLNEDDIVEAFIRHHATMVDHHLILDNGSTDETVNILKALKDEGLNISVFQNRCTFFNEARYNTELFKHARNAFGAEWAIFLDTDEFIDTRHVPEGLRALFASLPDTEVCLGLRNVTYFDHPTDDPAELTVPLRMRYREKPAGLALSKMFVRGGLASAAFNTMIEAGQHEVLIDGEMIRPFGDHALSLAHYYRRSPWQTMSKSVLGYLKVSASPKSERDKTRSVHYNDVFRFLRDDPEHLFGPGFLTPDYAEVGPELDPLPYHGGPLRYTPRTDPRFKAIRVLTAFAEQLAQAHAHFIDTNEGVRLQAEQQTYRWHHLF
jgi:glycosyltransferase involved in cell wall biosynthesis